ncbi:hypothetical protein DDT53_12730 [Mycobacteroides abscessus]|nr:hypothetical protein DDT53_12730 [Mycobacteroides abscessus]
MTMNKMQSRPGATKLVGLALALSVGTVGCSSHPTPSGPISAGESSSSAQARPLVDVEAVWATHPLPDCPKPPIERNGGAVPAGIELPTESTVSEILGDVKSPASEAWVRTKLGWVTQWLLQTRAGIVATSGANSTVTNRRFHQYIEHIRAEMEAGQDISDSALDGRFPEGCI